MKTYKTLLDLELLRISLFDCDIVDTQNTQSADCFCEENQKFYTLIA